MVFVGDGLSDRCGARGRTWSWRATRYWTGVAPRASRPIGSTRIRRARRCGGRVSDTEGVRIGAVAFESPFVLAPLAG